MKNNYNPYTVPENYFENMTEQATARFRNRRRTIRYSIAAMVVAIVLIITPIFIQTRNDQIHEEAFVSNNLAEMYEYDVFLQVNFTKK